MRPTPFNSLLRLTCLTSLAMASAFAQAQTLADGIRHPWRLYVFVSTQMPRTSLISLAREAADSGVVLVLNGFGDKAADMGAAERFIREVNEQCCAGKRVTWQINPKLYESLQIRQAPTFVLMQPGSSDSFSNVRVAGDMALANALKFFAQESKSGALRAEASRQYKLLFARRTD